MENIFRLIMSEEAGGFGFGLGYRIQFSGLLGSSIKSETSILKGTRQWAGVGNFSDDATTTHGNSMCDAHSVGD